MSREVGAPDPNGSGAVVRGKFRPARGLLASARPEPQAERPQPSRARTELLARQLALAHWIERAIESGQVASYNRGREHDGSCSRLGPDRGPARWTASARATLLRGLEFGKTVSRQPSWVLGIVPVRRFSMQANRTPGGPASRRPEPPDEDSASLALPEGRK